MSGVEHCLASNVWSDTIYLNKKVAVDSTNDLCDVYHSNLISECAVTLLNPIFLKMENKHS